jgi:hypothetical protein
MSLLQRQEGEVERANWFDIAVKSAGEGVSRHFWHFYFYKYGFLDRVS